MLDASASGVSGERQRTLWSAIQCVNVVPAREGGTRQLGLCGDTVARGSEPRHDATSKRAHDSCGAALAYPAALVVLRCERLTQKETRCQRYYRCSPDHPDEDVLLYGEKRGEWEVKGVCGRRQNGDGPPAERGAAPPVQPRWPSRSRDARRGVSD